MIAKVSMNCCRGARHVGASISRCAPIITEQVGRTLSWTGEAWPATAQGILMSSRFSPHSLGSLQRHYISVMDPSRLCAWCPKGVPKFNPVRWYLDLLPVKRISVDLADRKSFANRAVLLGPLLFPLNCVRMLSSTLSTKNSCIPVGMRTTSPRLVSS